MNLRHVAGLVLVLALVGFLAACGDTPAKNEPRRNPLAEAPLKQADVNKAIAEAFAKLPPPAPAVPQTATTTVTPKGDIKVDASNPQHTGIQQNVTVNLPTAGQPCCQPKVVAPAPLCCQARPVVRPAPRVYKAPSLPPRPAPQRVSSCAVEVNVVGPPSKVDIKDAGGRIVGSANIVGSGLVTVPCSYASSITGQTCLSGKNLSWDMDQRWFARARSFLASGQRVLNFGHPITFRKGGAV